MKVHEKSVISTRGSLLQEVIGWDIGGVNIKAARWQAGGWEVAQQPFAIWQRRDELAATLADMSARLGPANYGAMTVTAELSDAFRTKGEGIAFVLEAGCSALPNTELRIFGLDGQFHDIETAKNNHMLVAAANWLATAMVVASHHPDCILVDVGSTTTDIIPIKAGQVIAQGRHDPGRLVEGELLYTGALRTPVFATRRHVPLWGKWCPVAAELFATAQDVHLLLGHLTPEQCTSPSADGRPVTPEFAAERLARMVCADIDMLSHHEIQIIAQYIAAEQIHQISDKIIQVMSRSNVRGPLVAVGVGTFLVRAAATQLGLDCIEPADFPGGDAGNVAPAAAVALLFSAERDRV